MASLEGLQEQLRLVKAELERLAALIDGSERWDAPGIIKMLRELSVQVDKIQDEILLLTGKHQFSLWLIILLLLIGAAALIVSGYVWLSVIGGR